MAETGRQAIGRVARARRERLGLKQDQLAEYGGPGVSTVGKFERAAQEAFAVRTQQQMEKALGWSRGDVSEFVAAHEEGDTSESWEWDLIDAPIPDLSGGGSSDAVQDALDADVVSAIQSAGWLLHLVSPHHRSDAIKALFAALIPFAVADSPDELGSSMRAWVLSDGRAVLPPESNADAPEPVVEHTPVEARAVLRGGGLQRQVDGRDDEAYSSDPDGPEGGA